MARKEKITIQRDQNLEEIDAELEAAMSRLDGTNEKVVELLGTFEMPIVSETGGALANAEAGAEAEGEDADIRLEGADATDSA